MSNQRIRSICRDCAVDLGCEFRPGHIASSWTSICPVCESEKMLVALTDYCWSRDWIMFFEHLEFEDTKNITGV